MRPSKFILSVAVLSLAGALTVSADDQQNNFAPRRFFAQLRGGNEVPPISTNAMAILKLSLSSDESTLTFQLSWKGLTADAAAAHIHFGPTKVNGGVMVFFCGGGGQAACPPNPATPGDVVTIMGTITAANVVGPAAQGIDPPPANDFPEVIRAIRSGLAYANIHNAKFPSGEIRGAVMSSTMNEQ